MQEFSFSGWQTVMIAILVFFLGQQLNKRFPFLDRFNIPEPVSSGLLVSLLLAALYAVSGITIRFDLF